MDMDSDLGKMDSENGHVELQSFFDENGEEVKFTYIVQLEGEGEEPAIEIPNEGEISMDVDAKGVKSDDETLSLTYYPSTANQNICLDDEQASAVANLLEFHNQISKTNFQQIEIKEDNLVEQASSSQIVAPNSIPLVSLNAQGGVVMRQEVPSSQPALKTYSTNRKKEVPTKVNPKPVPPKSDPIPNSVQGLKVKKKRRLIIDTVKVIPNAEFKEQLANTSDIVMKHEMAPSTKKAMHYLTYGGVGKFFAYPGRKIMSVPLSKLFFSHLTMTTEVRNAPKNPNGVLEDLDPDLKTPISATVDVRQESQGHMYNRIYSDSIARRTANSFDQFVKGMSVNKPKSTTRKPAKYKDYRRKGDGIIKTDNKNIPHAIQCQVEPVENSPLVSSMDQDEICKPTISESEALVELVATNGEAETHSYTMTDVNGRVLDLDGSGSMYIYQGQLQDQEPGQMQSNLEILLAAAQQHTTEVTELSLTNELKEKEVNGMSKDDLLFCSAVGTEEGNIVIVDSNGERYTIFTNNISVLPEPPKTD